MKPPGSELEPWTSLETNRLPTKKATQRGPWDGNYLQSKEAQRCALFDIYPGRLPSWMRAGRQGRGTCPRARPRRRAPTSPTPAVPRNSAHIPSSRSSPAFDGKQADRKKHTALYLQVKAATTNRRCTPLDGFAQARWHARTSALRWIARIRPTAHIRSRTWKRTDKTGCFVGGGLRKSTKRRCRYLHLAHAWQDRKSHQDMLSRQGYAVQQLPYPAAQFDGQLLNCLRERWQLLLGS